MSERDTPEHRKLFLDWREMWRSGACHHLDLTGIVQRCLAETGNPWYFHESPPFTRSDLLKDLRRFRKTGRQEVGYPHSGVHKDLSLEARAAIATLVGAGVVGEEFTQIAEPRPLFSGLALARGGDALDQIAAQDGRRLSASIGGLFSSTGPLYAPSPEGLTLFIEDRANEAAGNGAFHERLTARWAAEFKFLASNGFRFFPAFELGRIDTFGIEVAKRGRRSGHEVSIDSLIFEGSLFCQEVVLESLTSLPIEGAW